MLFFLLLKYEMHIELIINLIKITESLVKTYIVKVHKNY